MYSVLKCQPVISTMTEAVPLSPPTVAWQVYCPAWDWRSGLMVRVQDDVFLTVKSPPVKGTGPIHCTVGVPVTPLATLTLHVRVYCRPRVGFPPAVIDTSTVEKGMPSLTIESLL